MWLAWFDNPASNVRSSHSTFPDVSFDSPPLVQSTATTDGTHKDHPIDTMNKEPLRSSCILLVLHICLLLITGFDVLYLLYMYSSIVLMSTPVLIILRYILYVLSF